MRFSLALQELQDALVSEPKKFTRATWEGKATISVYGSQSLCYRSENVNLGEWVPNQSDMFAWDWVEVGK